MTLLALTARGLFLLALPGLDLDAIDRAHRLCATQGVELMMVRGRPVGWAAVYDLGANRIELNLDNPHWRNAARDAAYGHVIGLYSSPHADHVIRHEIGHALFIARVGIAQAVHLQQSAVRLPRERIARVVSSLAAQDGLEFVAEVYAGLWARRVYPDDVMTYYESLWRQE